MRRHVHLHLSLYIFISPSSVLAHNGSSSASGSRSVPRGTYQGWQCPTRCYRLLPFANGGGCPPLALRRRPRRHHGGRVHAYARTQAHKTQLRIGWFQALTNPSQQYHVLSISPPLACSPSSAPLAPLRRRPPFPPSPQAGALGLLSTARYVLTHICMLTCIAVDGRAGAANGHGTWRAWIPPTGLPLGHGE